MGPTSRLSSVYPQTHQPPSLTPINTELDITLTTESSESSKQVCEACSQPIPLPKTPLDDRASTQVQRICDICTRTIAQNQNLPVSAAEPITAEPITAASITAEPVIDDPVDDPVLDDYDDDECKRKVRCMTYAVVTAIVAMGLFLLLVPGGSAEDLT